MLLNHVAEGRFFAIAASFNFSFEQTPFAAFYLCGRCQPQTRLASHYPALQGCRSTRTTLGVTKTPTLEDRLNPALLVLKKTFQ